MRRRVLSWATVLVALWAGPAWAHVTVQPNEAQPGTFSRFVVRVPNERPDAATVKVEVRFPPTVTNASFQPKSGWRRSVTMRTLDEPIEVFGEPVTEVIDTVTWEGGRIEPSEFDEFGFSVRTPDEAQTLVFAAVQTYSSGEEVRWVGEPDSDAPAARVTLVGEADGEGEPAQGEPAEGEPGGDEPDGEQPGVSADGASTLSLVLGGVGTLLGGAALVLALRNRPAAS